MESRLTKGLVFGLLICFVMACNTKKQEELPSTPIVDKEQIKAEIQAIETAFVTAYNDRNVDDISFYADDAISFLQGGRPLQGKAAIMESLKKDVENAPKGDKFTFITNEVFPSNDGNLVVEVGAFTLKDSTDTLINSGNYISVFEKRDGKYVCIRDMGASDKAKTIE